MAISFVRLRTLFFLLVPAKAMQQVARQRRRQRFFSTSGYNTSVVLWFRPVPKLMFAMPPMPDGQRWPVVPTMLPAMPVFQASQGPILDTGARPIFLGCGQCRPWCWIFPRAASAPKSICCCSSSFFWVFPMVDHFTLTFSWQLVHCCLSLLDMLLYRVVCARVCILHLAPWKLMVEPLFLKVVI